MPTRSRSGAVALSLEIGGGTPVKSFQCDFLRKDGHTVRSVRFLAPDREVAMLEAAKLLSWLAPRERSGGMIVRDGTTILAWLDGTS